MSIHITGDMAAGQLGILNDEPVKSIPITTNKSSKSYLNMDLANRLGSIFPSSMLKDAFIVGEQEFE